MLAARLVCLRALPSRVFHPAFTKASPVVKNSITKNQWLLTPSRVKIIFLYCLFVCAPGTFFFFWQSMKLPTLSLVINWKSPKSTLSPYWLLTILFWPYHIWKRTPITSPLLTALGVSHSENLEYFVKDWALYGSTKKSWILSSKA